MLRKNFQLNNNLTYLFVTIVFLFVNCSKSINNVTVAPPTIIIGQITKVTDSSVLVGAQITFDGNGEIKDRGIVFGEQPQLTFNNSKIQNGFGSGSFETSINGLLPGKKYYVRAYALNSAGSSFSEELSFETNKILPSLKTIDTSKVTLSSAKVGGIISNDGGSIITSRGVVYGKNPNPTITDNKTTDGSGLGSFESLLDNLIYSTKYYVRAYATNSVGTAYGNEISFTTQSPNLPTLTTKSIKNITAKFAFSGGDISKDGGAPITVSGVCWSTSKNPTITDNKTNNGRGVGSFDSEIGNLKGNTVYYVRAYATNPAGTAYGQEVSLTTLQSITDVDGNVYNTVLIGNQLWMSENLKVTKYRNGDPVCLLLSTNDCATADQKWRSIYENNQSYVAKYGYWYSWFAATDQRGLCPVGTHLPDNSEWLLLINAYGQNLVLWTNQSGFNSLYSGDAASGGSNYLNLRAYYQSSTPISPGYNNALQITVPGYPITGAMITSRNNLSGLSVRCIKD